MTSAPRLENGRPSLYDDPLFSDVKVKFGRRTFNGHKAILCRQSKYFEKALMGNFQEAKSGIIDLGGDDDAIHVDAMLRHLYGLHYHDYTNLFILDENLEFDAEVFRVADKYDIASLREKVVNEAVDTMCDDYVMGPHANFDGLRKAFSVPVGDSSLQEALLKTCIENMLRWLPLETFSSVLAEAPLLACKLLQNKFRDVTKEIDVRVCRSCNVYRIMFTEGRCCQKCRRPMSEEWGVVLQRGE